MNLASRGLSTILALSLIWTTTPAEAVQAISPPGGSEVHVYRITPRELRLIEPLLQRHADRPDVSIIRLAQNPDDPALGDRRTSLPSVTNSAAASNSTQSATNGTLASATNQVADNPPQDVPVRSSSSDSSRIGGGVRGSVEGGHSEFYNLIGDLCNIDCADNDVAIVIFVIVGAVVVLAVVAYAGVVLYDIMTGSEDCSYWWDAEIQANVITSGHDRGSLAGARLRFGVADPAGRVGLVLEGGYMDAEVRPDEETQGVEVNDTYVLGGAGARWDVGGPDSNPSYLGFELLAGTAATDDVGLMSTARIDLSFGLGERTRLGFSVGALYLGLHTTDGLLKDIDSFSTLLGVQTGFRF